MKLFRKCKIISIPYKLDDHLYNLIPQKTYNNEIINYIYVISDDQLKENDWVVYKNENGDFKIKRIINVDENNSKKIIASNNKYLKLPKIPKDIINGFIKENQNNIETDIKVEYDRSYSGRYDENDIWKWDEHKLKVDSKNYINVLTLSIEQI